MQFKKTILKNGLRVITVPMAGNPTVTLMINVATGSYYEKPEQAGLSHFLEHMCFKGTSKRPDSKIIATELDSIGAVYNAFTTQEMTGYYAKADVSHFQKIGDILVDIYTNSIFPESEIEKEKGVVYGEIDMYADDPQEKVHDALRVHMYKGEPAEKEISGTKESVKALTRNQLIDYRKTQYGPSNTVIIIAGGITESEMLSFVEKNMGSIEDSAPTIEFLTKDRNQDKPETVFIDKDTDQAHIVMSWRTFDRLHPDRFIAHVIRSILRSGMSSRLFVRLREEMGSGYYIGAGNSLHKSFGKFSVSTGTTAERVAEIVTAIISETEKLKTELVPKVELEKVKEYLRAHTRMSLETSGDVADFYADQEVLGDKIRTPEDYEAIIGAINEKDIMRVAKSMFNNQKLTVAVIGKGIDRESVSKAIGA